MSALAEVYDKNTLLSSHDIAASRNLSQPLVAKILSTLSQGGLVIGNRGPGGGYRLARDPGKISIYEVVDLFEGHQEISTCPYGPGWCPSNDPCPLHNILVQLRENGINKLKKTYFNAFTHTVKPTHKT